MIIVGIKPIRIFLIGFLFLWQEILVGFTEMNML
jgi:hypothetical protein